VQQPAERGSRVDRVGVRPPTHVDKQLPVGEPLGQAVRDVDRQYRLAHPGRTGDHRDGHRVGHPRPALGQRTQRRAFGVPAGQARDVGGQLPRYVRAGQRRRTFEGCGVKRPG
jgi:hypothetical protein